MVIASAVTWYTVQHGFSYRTDARTITVHSGPDGKDVVSLDTTEYLPSGVDKDHPAPAILLAHGFGGSKDSVADDARRLTKHGYVVLAYTARGFGNSGGEIHLDSPDYEVNDARRLIDWLATRPEVTQDGKNDPRVGVVGGSYGGGLALLAAAYDHRIDAIVPEITWNSLPRSFFPDATGQDPIDGVYKRAWVGDFFGTLERSTEAPQTSDNPACGRFATDACQAYLAITTAGKATPQALELLERSSPASVIANIKAPTLLIQGAVDSLFPLSEANANARGIAANGTPVRVAWFQGGHDGGPGPQSDVDRTRYLTAQWLDYYLKGKGDQPSTSFTYSRTAGINANNGRATALGYSATPYPGLEGDAQAAHVSVGGPEQRIANPPDGTPAAISSIPGLGALSSFAGATNRAVREVAGQHATFDSPTMHKKLDIVGSPKIAIRTASPTGEAVLFVKLYDVDAHGSATLPSGLVAPVRLTNLPTSIAQATPVTVTLPAIVRRIEEGHRLRIVISSSDQAYAAPPAPTTYSVALGSNGADSTVLTLPNVDGHPLRSTTTAWWWGLVGAVLVIGLGIVSVIVLARRRHRRADRSVLTSHTQTPLIVRGLRKEYRDGFIAVSDVSFMVERGQVVGLLGPNGAGKTTSLRVLMGLTRATAGEIFVFGHRLAPGAPVLSQLGALVEGPGFLPHLSGVDNLRLYWRATGRPSSDAHLDEVLRIAALGDAVSRKVRTYSHGMKQRLAIAQAMLGLPQLLILDEPTDGLDPPQIAEMRRVLHEYARTDGRAVLVSSHLLAEVEQTCTHVVVVSRGKSVASGTVSEVVGASPTVLFDVSDLDRAHEVLINLPGVASASADPHNPGSLVVDLADVPRSEAVAALVHADVGVERVTPRRRLEDAFLALVEGDNS